MAIKTSLEKAEGAIRAARFRLSSILKAPDLRLVNKDDIEALVELDGECFEDLYFEADEFGAELSIPSTYGIILYNAPLIITPTTRVVTIPSKRFAISYMMGHEDIGMNDVPKAIASQNGKGGYFVSTAVKPEFQRKGIFTHLLNCFEDLSRMQGMEYLRLHTRTKDNPDSKGDYIAFQKRGFRVTGTIHDHLDKGDHFYEMVKRLDKK